ncbi:hypothetical protein GCM10028791_34020 [Echinicola sediminis]
MHIIFNPVTNEENQYIQIMVSPLKKAGYQVHKLDTIFSSIKHFRRIKLVHLNWFENVDDSSSFKALISFMRKMIVLTAIHLFGKKLVWTMHNRVSHEKKTGNFSEKLNRKLIQWSDAIVIHCSLSQKLLTDRNPSLAHKIHHIPHPDFIGCYGPFSDNPETTDNKLRLLFIGAIKPYKNIELLIESIGPLGKEVELTIAGKPKDERYHKVLSKLAAPYPNINLQLQFIPDGLLPLLIGKSDLLIMPYDLKSSLNSGTAILAFSYKKTVICPKIGTLVDMEEAERNFFSYLYTSEEEHKQKITEKVQEAISLKKSDSTILQEMGNNMFAFVRDQNNKFLVGEKLKDLYRSILD